MSTIVEAKGLTKRFDQFIAVDGIDFAIPAGCCFGFLGPNGAGKTTTLRMMLGLSPISAGSLTLFGLRVPEDEPAIHARVGIVPQMDNLDPDFTVAENLRVYASYFGLPNRAFSATALEQRIASLLAFVELNDRANTRIDKLSGGMKRRLTMARALINEPELLILDEPTTGLDPQVRHAIWSRLRELLRTGKTIILITHYIEEAERLCDELVIIDHGRILQQGSPAALIQQHVESEVVEIRHHGSEILRDHLKTLTDCRVEEVNNLLYCYAQQARPIIHWLEDDNPNLTFLHRRGNLEDVFLRLTGHELRD